jgi:hypothetical protein
MAGSRDGNATPLRDARGTTISIRKVGQTVPDFERNFRANGLIAAVLFVVSYAIYGNQPHARLYRDGDLRLRCTDPAVVRSGALDRSA